MISREAEAEIQRIFQDQSGIRRQPISPALAKVLNSAASAAGVQVHVFSGGQKSNKRGQGTGSTRHNGGFAADLNLYVNGRKLDYGNKSDLPIIQKFIASAVQAGATGIGAGPGYMGTGIHVGFGPNGNPNGPVTVWGKNGDSANAPTWLRQTVANAADLAGKPLKDVTDPFGVGNFNRQFTALIPPANVGDFQGPGPYPRPQMATNAIRDATHVSPEAFASLKPGAGLPAPIIPDALGSGLLASGVPRPNLSPQSSLFASLAPAELRPSAVPPLSASNPPNPRLRPDAQTAIAQNFGLPSTQLPNEMAFAGMPNPTLRPGRQGGDTAPNMTVDQMNPDPGQLNLPSGPLGIDKAISAAMRGDHAGVREGFKSVLGHPVMELAAKGGDMANYMASMPSGAAYRVARAASTDPSLWNEIPETAFGGAPGTFNPEIRNPIQLGLLNATVPLPRERPDRFMSQTPPGDIPDQLAKTSQPPSIIPQDVSPLDKAKGWASSTASDVFGFFAKPNSENAPPPIMPSINPVAAGTPTRGYEPRPSFDTALTPEQEAQFQAWKAINAPNDSGQDYDLRGAFQDGLSPATNGHWADTYKKPNHPTFSDESIYAAQRPQMAGHWNGDTFVPPTIAEDRLTRGSLSDPQSNGFTTYRAPSAPPGLTPDAIRQSYDRRNNQQPVFGSPPTDPNSYALSGPGHSLYDPLWSQPNIPSLIPRAPQVQSLNTAHGGGGHGVDEQPVAPPPMMPAPRPRPTYTPPPQDNPIAKIIAAGQAHPGFLQSLFGGLFGGAHPAGQQKAGGQGGMTFNQGNPTYQYNPATGGYGYY